MQTRLGTSDKVLKLNVSLDIGVTCLNPEDFTDEETGETSGLSHKGWHKYATIEERKAHLQEFIDAFKTFYNCENVEFFDVPNPFQVQADSFKEVKSS